MLPLMLPMCTQNTRNVTPLCDPNMFTFATRTDRHTHNKRCAMSDAPALISGATEARSTDSPLQPPHTPPHVTAFARSTARARVRFFLCGSTALAKTLKTVWLGLHTSSPWVPGFMTPRVSCLVVALRTKQTRSRASESGFVFALGPCVVCCVLLVVACLRGRRPLHMLSFVCAVCTVCGDKYTQYYTHIAPRTRVCFITLIY